MHTFVARTLPRPRALFVLLALGMALLAGCMSPEEQSFVDRANQLRAEVGAAPLAPNDILTVKAQAWAQRMADDGKLSHSTLREGVAGLSWTSLSENVGTNDGGGDWALRLHEQLASSPGHRRNLVDPKATHIGVGVARSDDGQVYVTQVFASLP